MADNTERFTGRVRDYARFRREYPAEQILGFLRRECGLQPEWRVADIAAGTGMLTEVLLRNGNRVVAIEPNAEMREVCGGLRAEWPELGVENGTAEATGLESGSMTMVTAGRAFHWFEPEAAAIEFRRILKTQGWVVLVSSGRRRDDGEQGRAFEQMLLEHGTDAEYGARRRMRQDGGRGFLEGLGQPTSYKRVSFEEARTIAFEEFRGMVQSISCAPLEGDSRYAGMQRALEKFFAWWSDGGELAWAEECVVEVGQVG